jgi:hypothetical protein
MPDFHPRSNARHFLFAALIGVLFFLWSHISFAAIAFDASSGKSLSGASSPTTLSHTVAAGSDMYLLCFFGGGTNTNDISTGMSYAGVAMTRFAFASSTDASTGVSETGYYLANPTTGTNNVSTTWTGTATISLQCSSFSGAAQNAPDSSHIYGIAYPSTASPENLTTTVVASSSWLVGAADNGAATFSAATGTTKRNEQATGMNASLLDSSSTVGTGSQSLQVTWTGSNNLAGIVASICPASGCGGLGLNLLDQYLVSSTSTEIGVGSSTTENKVTFGAKMQAVPGATASLQVEVEQAGVGFTGTPSIMTATSSVGPAPCPTLLFSLIKIALITGKREW